LDLIFGLVLGNAVAFLYFADQLLAVAGDDIQFIVGEFAPFYTGFALELLPIACRSFPKKDLSGRASLSSPCQDCRMP